MENLKGALLQWFLVAIFIIAGLGWCLNFVKFVKLDFRAPYKAEIIRGIGVFSPIGSIIGYIHINDY